MVLWGFGRIPDGLAVRLGLALGWFLEHVVRFRRGTVSQQQALAFPALDAAQRRALRHDTYRHLGLLVIEDARLPTLSPDKLTALCAISGTENISPALARGKGVLVLAAHIGNWELGLAATTRLGVRTRTVVKEIKGAVGQYLVDRMRGAHGVETIPRRQAIRQIVATFREGGAIGFVLDQNMTSDEGVFVDFFGRPACTMAGLAVLAHRFDVPVLPVRFCRDPDLRRHHVEILPAIPWESVGPTPEDDVRHNTQRYTKALEQMIVDHPAQWLWVHRRWKTQPAAAVAPEAG